MNQELLREQLCKVTDYGIKSVAISRITGIDNVTLSRFKNGRILLKRELAIRLKEFLDKFTEQSGETTTD